MSRVAKKPVTLAKGVELNVAPELITVKGPKGTLTVPKVAGIDVVIEDGVATLKTENADLVAAKNIRERGLNSLKGQGYGRIACEVNGAVRPSAAGTHRSEHLASVK